MGAKQIARPGGPRGTAKLDAERVYKERGRDRRVHEARSRSARTKEQLLAQRRCAQAEVDEDEGGSTSKKREREGHGIMPSNKNAGICQPPVKFHKSLEETGEHLSGEPGKGGGKKGSRRRPCSDDVQRGMETRSAKRQRIEEGAAASKTYVDDCSPWEPPVSPYALLEEELYQDPWKLLISCMLLNKTSATQVRQVIWKLFERYPTPHSMIAALNDDLEQLLQPLGLFRKRAQALRLFSRDYIEKDWSDPRELYGIGTYASDAYTIFCVPGGWRTVKPDDKDLKLYVDFLQRTDGLGVGFQRYSQGCTP